MLSHPRSSVGTMPPTDPTDLLARRCRELIDIPSVSGDEHAVEDALVDALPGSLHVVHRDDTVVLALPERRPGHPFVVLAGHTDTVPIEGNVPSTLDRGVIHGRGASDMKGGLAVMIEVARWRHHQADAPIDVGLLFFGREELAASRCPLLPALQSVEHFRSIDLAVLMEPTANAIELGCQGNLNLTLRFNGAAAHSARPWTGRNAAHDAITALGDLARSEPRDVQVGGLSFREVAGVVGIRSGVARNVVPATAEVDVNVRYPPGEEPGAAARRWADRFAALGCDVEVVSDAPPAEVPSDHPLTIALRSAAAAPVRAKQAWTNASDFSRVGIPVLNFGPGDPAFAHRADEQVAIAALRESFDILCRFVRTPVPAHMVAQ